MMKTIIAALCICCVKGALLSAHCQMPCGVYHDDMVFDQIDQVIIDSRRIESENSLFVALPGENTDGHCFVKEVLEKKGRFALVKKGHGLTDLKGSGKLLEVESPLTAMQEIANAYRKTLPVKIFALTGSYGKTMVKDLLHEILNTTYVTAATPESYNSQIGVPLSIFTLSKNHEVAVMEAAISEKNEMQRLAAMLLPDFGMITHIGKKHLDRIGSLEELAKELSVLFSDSDRILWNFIPNKTHFSEIPHFTSYLWNQKEDHLPHAEIVRNPSELFPSYQITFPDGLSYKGKITSGFSYYLDLLNMCVKASFKLGVSSSKICKILDSYTLEPIRTEIWKSPMGVTFINDHYAEDPQSIDKAFKFLSKTTGTGRKIFFFGGLRGKKPPSDYKKVGEILARHSFSSLYLIGTHPFAALQEALVSKIIPIHHANTFEEALLQYKCQMQSDDILLIKGWKKESFEKVQEVLHESPTSNICMVNLAAIEQNIKTIRLKLPPKTRLMVMVKALAYGTDDYRIAKFLKTCGVDILGVSYVDEGVALKRGGVTQTIFVLNAALFEVAKVVKWDLEVGVSDAATISALEKQAEKEGKKAKVHLHVDTGMGRFGCHKNNAVSLAKMAYNSPNLELVGIMTHFAAADDPKEDEFTLQQAKELEEIIEQLENLGIHIPWRHAANSSATARFQFSSFNMARIGLAVYGLYPSDTVQQTIDLRLAISLVSKIVGINECTKGDTISYGRTYKVKRGGEKIAVLPIGYFDGLHRNYSGKGHVMIRGKKAPMVGRICMDFMMVDISSIPEASLGDPVLIFGEDEYGDYLSPENLAESGDSITHELITCLGPRIQRVFIYEDANTHKSGKLKEKKP